MVKRGEKEERGRQFERDEVPFCEQGLLFGIKRFEFIIETEVCINL